ncbi:phylloplanin-like [Miscanthus floridulus]|uniref:phylloplanin-like n=1 Tax=Miscanthus floridulus TaxID=154761 RepID=UPI00345A80B6
MASKALLLLAAAVVAAACVVGAADAKFGRLGRLVITGVVPCNTGSLIDIATSPAFPNADVELRCAGKVVAGATTNTNGTFSMELDMTNALAAFIGGCTLVVDTPLIKCNADLTDVGSLVSYLQGPLTRLLGGIFHLFPAGFSFHARRA